MIAGSPLYKGLGLPNGMEGLFSGDPEPKMKPANTAVPAVINPNAPDIPLYIPKDTVRPIQIQDARKINPATGQPFRKGGAMTANVNPNVVNAIIKQAMNKGVDPNTALAIALQETHMGNQNENVGSAWSTFPDEGIEDPYEQGANSMVKTLVDKLAYAKRLGYDKKGEAFALQAYNGYGKLTPRQTTGNPTEYFYEIPTTRSNPLNMAQNPVYGKTIMSLRDEIIKKNPELQALIKKAMTAKQGQQAPMQAPVMAYSRK